MNKKEILITGAVVVVTSVVVYFLYKKMKTTKTNVTTSVANDNASASYFGTPSFPNTISSTAPQNNKVVNNTDGVTDVQTTIPPHGTGGQNSDTNKDQNSAGMYYTT